MATSTATVIPDCTRIDARIQPVALSTVTASSATTAAHASAGPTIAATHSRSNRRATLSGVGNRSSHASPAPHASRNSGWVSSMNAHRAGPSNDWCAGRPTIVTMVLPSSAPDMIAVAPADRSARRRSEAYRASAKNPPQNARDAAAPSSRWSTSAPEASKGSSTGSPEPRSSSTVDPATWAPVTVLPGRSGQASVTVGRTPAGSHWAASGPTHAHSEGVAQRQAR